MEKALLQFIYEGGRVSVYFAFALAFAASLIKYVVPPLPGDLTILLLSFYVTMKQQSLVPVAVGIALGGTIGAIAAYKIGSKGSGAGWVFFGEKIQNYYDRMEAPFRKSSFFIMAFNRFLPGIRPFIFPLAGAYKIDFGLAAASAVIGNIVFGAFIYTVVLFAGRHLQQVKVLYHILGLWLEFLVISVLVASLVFLYRKKIFKLIRRDG